MKPLTKVTYRRMQFFIHTVIIIAGFCLKLGNSDGNTKWNLRLSSPSGDGRFVKVPIQYGDWVPITKAKQTIEAVASKIEAAINPVKRKDPPSLEFIPDHPEERIDVQNVPYDEQHPSQNRRHWFQPQESHQSHQAVLYHQQEPASQQWQKSHDGRTRSQRKLSSPQSTYNNQFTSVFQSASQVVTTVKPLRDDTTSGSSILGSFLNFFNPLFQTKQDILLHNSPVIKTLPAPDLTKSEPDLTGGYVEGAENLYIDQLEEIRRDHNTYKKNYDHFQNSQQQSHIDHQKHSSHHQSHHLSKGYLGLHPKESEENRRRDHNTNNQKHIHSDHGSHFQNNYHHSHKDQHKQSSHHQSPQEHQPKHHHFQQLSGGYVDGAEYLYVNQLKAKRREDYNKYNQHQVHHNQGSHVQNNHHKSHLGQHQLSTHHLTQTTRYQPQNHQIPHPTRPTYHHKQHIQKHEKRKQDSNDSPSSIDIKLDHFIPGLVEDIELPLQRHPNLDKKPSNFSVLVSGLSKSHSSEDFVNFFKEDVVQEKKHKAFITDNQVDTPEGFEKITLPFLDPSQAEKQNDDLPSVFIAPIGYKVPDGYKGHPLPYDPSITDEFDIDGKNLVHNTEETPLSQNGNVKNPFLKSTIKPILKEPEQKSKSVVIEEPKKAPSNEPVLEVEQEKIKDVSGPTALVLKKIKLVRNKTRAHLASLYKNQAGPITTIIRDSNGRKRKRVLKKVVRKPYNPGKIATSAIQKESKGNVATEVHIVDGPDNAEHEVRRVRVNGDVINIKPIVPIEDNETTLETTEDILNVVTTTEPYQNLDSEATTSNEYQVEESKDHNLFVTTPRPTLTPINFITRKSIPKISADIEDKGTTTPIFKTSSYSSSSTELPATTITFAKPNFLSKDTTESYQPKKFSPLDPFKRHKFKTTQKPIETKQPILKLRKIKKVRPTYGQRIKVKQRPSYWANFGESTTHNKKDEIKSKFRPFFDHIYEQLTKTTSTVSPPLITTESKRLLPYLDQTQSTTSTYPFSKNTDVYETDPDSKYEDSLSTSYVHADDEYYDDEYYESEYNAQPRLDQVGDDIEFIEVEDTTEHEEADKYFITDDQHVEPTVLPSTDYHDLEAQNYIESKSSFVDSGIELHYGESQQHSSSIWNEVVPLPPPGIPTARELDSYSKDFTPLHEIASQHDKNYKQPSGFFNEHSQLFLDENDSTPFKEYDAKKPRIPYVEIKREGPKKDGQTINEVPVGDNDFIQNGFEELYNKIPTTTASPDYINELIDLEHQPVEKDVEYDIEEDKINLTSITPNEFEIETTTLPGRAIVEHDVIEEKEEADALSTTKTELETTQSPMLEIELTTTTIEEAEPTAEAGQESIEYNIIDDDFENLFTTTPYSEQGTDIDSFGITTFRPRGGFLDSLSNFISRYLPAKTTKETIPLPTTITPTTATETTQTVTAELLDVNSNIIDVDVTNTVIPSQITGEKQTTLEEATTVKLETESTVTDTILLETTEVPAPTANDHYQHLESIKNENILSQSSVKELHVTRMPEEIAGNENVGEISNGKEVSGATQKEEDFKSLARNISKSTLRRSTTTTPLTLISLSSTSSLPTLAQVKPKKPVTLEKIVLLPFAPTVLPKLNEFERQQKKISLLEKLKDGARNSIFKNNRETQNTDFIIKSKPTTTTKKPLLYPRGSRLNLFKKWAGNSLSQAEFEKNILGVSTAQEVKVQSRICVRGHCYNADDEAAASSLYENKFR